MTPTSTVRFLREKAGLSQAALAKEIGVDRSAVAQWENGFSQPRMGNLKKLAAFFGVPISILLNEIDRSEKGETSVVLQALSNIHANSNADEGSSYELIDVPRSVLSNHPTAKAVLVEGDCMSRVIPEGAIVVYDPSLEPANGQIAIVETEDWGTLLRRWYRINTTVVLVADSFSKHEDIIIKQSDAARPIGTVVWMQCPLDK